jgi:hypothetical protein
MSQKSCIVGKVGTGWISLMQALASGLDPLHFAKELVSRPTEHITESRVHL